MSGGSKKQTVGYKYSLGAHMGFCHGPIDKVTRIRVADRVAWEGESTGGQIFIDNEDLFGGPEREGGIFGAVDFEFGEPAQDVNDYLQAQQNVGGEIVPAYRGIAAAVLRQVYLGTNPYLKPWEFRAQRIHTSTRGAVQWYDEKSEVPGGDGEAIDITSFEEDFESGLGSYSFSGEGASSTFTIGSDDYGACLLADHESRSSNVSLTSPIVDEASHSVKFRFKVTDINAGDAPMIRIYDATTGGMSITPVRNSSQDSLRRMWYGDTLTSPSQSPISDVTVTVDQWYEVEVKLNTSFVEIIVTDLSDNSEFANFTTIIPSFTTNRYGFNIASGSATVVKYDEIKFITGIAFQSGDMNPAHIIRECLTDTSWGLGYTAADIDDTSFTAAADTLFEEEFGISLLWSQQTPIEDFILDILRHIDGTLYVHPRTGKFTLKLIRNDYAAGSLPILDESNIISISDYKKPTIGELTNYVTIKYWDRSTSEDSAISVQDIALAQQQASVVSATIPMPGITRGELASRVASRELTALSNPLITCTIIANREAASLNIGDAFKLSWPKFGLTETIMRVTNSQFGTLTDGRVKIECVQDVFGLPQATFSAPTDSNFVNPTNAPANSPFRLVQEANYWTLIQDQGEDFELDPLDGYLLTAATTPSADAINYRIWTDESGSYEEKEAADFCPTATLTNDLPKATDGVINITVGITGLAADDVDDIDIGSIAQIGNELLEVVAVSTTEATFGRAVADSAIEDHSTGDRIFFWGNSFYGAVGTLYQDNDTIGVKITPLTAQGQLDVVDATEQLLTFDQRAYRAWNPGNVQLAGSYFPDSIEGVESVDSAWAHRDRTLQTAGLNDFTEGSIGPEAGTTYTTTLTRVNTSAQLDQNTGITVTTDSLDPSGYDGLVRYSIASVRDALDSFYSQTHEFIVTRTSAVQEEQGAFMFTEDNEAIITES